MRHSSKYLCWISVWLLFGCAALAQAPRPEAGPAGELPEAPAAQPILPPQQIALIKPAIKRHTAPPHRFFDKTNLWLHAGAIVAETADLVTTHRAIEAGAVEANPLARPLVRRGLGGQVVSAYGLGEGALLLTSYIFHRTGHHRLERFVPVTAIAVEGLATASNVRTRNSLER